MEAQEIKQQAKKKKRLIAVVVILGYILIFGTGIAYVNFARTYSALKQEISKYNEAVKNYNTVADEYENIQQTTSLENVEDLPKINKNKTYLDDDISFLDSIKSDISQKAIIQDTAHITEETNELLYALMLAQQITNPDEEWVIERLKPIDEIVEVQAVTKRHDPNQLLEADGGYTSCIYFSAEQIEQKLVGGKDTVDKGTDAGGAIEVYKTVTDAQNRCDYLGQFDNTLLYSGSFAILGTVVIRTSYLLTNEQQMELTNKIAAEFTALK